jgi:hypothetical protein
MDETPLEAARAQLKYWKEECAGAVGTDRKEQCERFIRQCELVVSALEEAEQHALK